MKKSYESLIEDVKNDCVAGRNCFNPNGCDKDKSCFHSYCDKFKWIIERSKHYAEKTNLNWEDILNSWEMDRSYWYMNYYQDYNQPLIECDKVRVFETVQDLLDSVGEKQFRCPCCNGVSSDPYACNSGIIVSKKSEKICDWKVYGFFRGMGKSSYVFCKDKMKCVEIFTPISWEDTSK